MPYTENFAISYYFSIVFHHKNISKYQADFCLFKSYYRLILIPKLISLHLKEFIKGLTINPIQFYFTVFESG